MHIEIEDEYVDLQPDNKLTKRVLDEISDLFDYEFCFRRLRRKI